MTTTKEMREMVLVHAHLTAKKVVEQVRSTDIEFGTINETFDVAGAEWHVVAKYYREHDEVRVEGHPHAAPSERVDLGNPMLNQIFGIPESVPQVGDGGFQFSLPAGWLPEVGAL